jgi:FKBP-type peptidyl-prolyl cis-trans isomerase SlyD
MKVTIKKNRVVSLEYELCNEEGIVLDSNKGFDPIEYVQGSGNMLAGLEQALEGWETNKSGKITLLPLLGFGVYDDALVYRLPIEDYLHSGFINIGDTIQLPDGREAIIIAKEENYLTADANHPLAGQTLYYDVTIKNVREASDEEIACGYPLATPVNCSDLPGCC